MGTVMAAQFAFGGFANAFLLAPLTKLLGGHVGVVVRNCVVIMGTTYFVQAFVFSSYVTLPGGAAKGYIYIGLALFLSIFQFSLSTSITAATTTIVPKHLVGTLMGIEHSMFALAGILGPIVGTQVFEYAGVAGLAAVCGMLFFAVMALWVVASKPDPSSMNAFVEAKKVR